MRPAAGERVSSHADLLSRRAGVLWIGTDPKEQWESPEAVLQAWRAQTAELGGPAPITGPASAFRPLDVPNFGPNYRANTDLQSLNYAQQDFERQSDLAEKKIASQQKLQETRMGLDVARQRISAAQEDLQRIEAQLAGDPKIRADDHPRRVDERIEEDGGEHRRAARPPGA